MTGDKLIRGSTIGAVAVVALVAGWVSYRHALAVVSGHGESGAIASAYPLTIDGMIYAASMVLLNAARQQIRPPSLAYFALGLGIAATLAANIAAGLATGVVGAVVAAWPAPALVISYELLMLVIRSTAVTVVTHNAAPVRQDAAAVAEDAQSAAAAALAASIAASNPISQRQLMTRFGLTRTAERKVRQSVLAMSDGQPA